MFSGKPLRLLLGLICGLALLAAAPAGARVMKAKNSYVVLDLPDSFEEQDRFAGFNSKDAGATVMVLDLPRDAYLQFQTGFDKELKKKGYSDIRRDRLPERTDEHIFFYARQHTPVGQFDKYLLIFRNDKRAAYVTITVNPVEQVLTPLSYVEARIILSKIHLSDKPARETRFYRLAYKAGFKVRNTIVGSTTLYVLKNDQSKPGQEEKSTKPMFVVAPSLSKRKVKDLKKTSRTLIYKFSRFADMKPDLEETLEVDGMQGYGLSGTATHKASNKPVGVYQLVLAAPTGGYYRLVGVAPKERFGHFLDEFRRMARSFRLSKQVAGK